MKEAGFFGRLAGKALDRLFEAGEAVSRPARNAIEQERLAREMNEEALRRASQTPEQRFWEDFNRGR